MIDIFNVINYSINLLKYYNLINLYYLALKKKVKKKTKMKIIDTLSILNMCSLLAIFVISILLHTFLFYTINLGYLGKDFKEKLKIFLVNRITLISILYFILIIIINFYVQTSVIYLDGDVVLTTNIKNSEIILSGDMLNLILDNFGSAGVFIAGAKIAASLVTKHPIGILSKVGIIGGTGVGFTVGYKIVNKSIPNSFENMSNISIETGPIEIKLEGIKYASNVSNTEFKSLLDKYFGISKSISNLNYNENFNINTNTLEIISNREQTSKVISELDKTNPNWRYIFINSPLESDNPIIKFILDSLTNNLILNFICIYLLIMLLIILIIKFILSSNINFDRLNKYPLGNYINRFLVKFISIWQKSNNFWIFFIIIVVIIFNILSSFSIYQLISVLS
jgi:hypothetical protein